MDNDDKDNQYKKLDDKMMNLILAVASGIISGFLLTLNTVFIEFTCNVGADVDQACYDGNLVLFLIECPYFMIDWLVNDYPYTLENVALATISVLLVTLAIITFGRAIKVG